jgi:hypothetical protein
VRALFVVGASGLLLSSCIEFGEPRDDVPGELLGDYAVVGRLETNDCGEGALGSTDRWDFDVRLSRQGSELFWGNGREVITGAIADDRRHFTFEATVAVAITEPKGQQPGCTVRRTDRADGELHGIDDDVAGFDGTLSYSFTEADDADCSALTEAPDGVSALPCSMTYALVAERDDETVR